MGLRNFYKSFKWKNWHLTYKFLLIYLPLIILPTIFSMYFLTTKYNETSRAEIETNTKQLLDTVVDRVDEQFLMIEELSLNFFLDYEIISGLQAIPQSYIEQTKLHRSLATRVSVLINNLKPYIDGVTLISNHGHQYNFGYIDTQIKPKFLTQMDEAEGRAIWEYSLGSSASLEPNVETPFVIGRNINHMEKFTKIGQVIFYIDPSLVRDVFNDLTISDSAYFTLMTSDDQLIYTGGNIEAGIEESSLEIPLNSTVYDFTLVTSLPLELLNSMNNKIKYYPLWFALICLTLGMLMTHLINIDIIIPIKKLLLNMKQGIRGQKPAQLQTFKGAREILDLNHTFIAVMYEIVALNKDKLTEQKRKQKIEISVLQKQLSPHFLYNTLNSIRWMAIIQKQDNIKVMVDSLTRLLSYTIREVEKPVTLQEELSVLHDYVNIQKVRYQNFTFYTDIPENLKERKILKLLIQPLVENALIHGLSEVNYQGRLTVEAYEKKQTLYILIKDNGAGMPIDKLAKLKTILRNGGQQNHLGIRSIHERIQLHFGAQYGIEMDSVMGQGTEIMLTLPIRLEEEDRI